MARLVLGVLPLIVPTRARGSTTPLRGWREGSHRVLAHVCSERHPPVRKFIVHVLRRPVTSQQRAIARWCALDEDMCARDGREGVLRRALAGSAEPMRQAFLERLAREGRALELTGTINAEGEFSWCAPRVSRATTCLAMYFGWHRVLTASVAPLRKAPPTLFVDGIVYELVTVRFLDRPIPERRCSYIATAGPELRPMDLCNELERLADFRSVRPPRKRAARLELLASSAQASAYLDTSAFEVLADDVSPETGECLSDGCGFAPDWMVDRMASIAGLQPADVCALQIRVYSPALGIFKGMLLRRPDICRVQLRPSMRKVGPAVATTASEALVLAKKCHPSATNRHRKALAGAQRQRVPSVMVRRLLCALGVAKRDFDAYIDEMLGVANLSQLRHASLTGVADPFGALPAGCVFVPGLGEHSRIMVTRFPCVKPEHARLLKLVTRPSEGCAESMTDDVWRWLTSLPFGVIVFSMHGTRSLPRACGEGDLDGDLYFCCWDEAHILPNLCPRPLPLPPAKAPSPQLRADEGHGQLDFLREAQPYVDSYEADRQEIGRLFRDWEFRVQLSPQGLDDPRALELASAYLTALNAGKHGGDKRMPSSDDLGRVRRPRTTAAVDDHASGSTEALWAFD